jgi:hypothetical protein
MGTVYEIKNRDFSVITEIRFPKKTEIYRDLPRKKNKKYREFRIKKKSFIALETRFLKNFNWFKLIY